MCATLLLETRNFGGVDVLGKHLTVNPQLPAQWQALKFKHTFQGGHYTFAVDHEKVTVTVDQPSSIQIAGKNYDLQANKPLTVAYAHK